MASTIQISAVSPSSPIVGTDEVTISAVLQHLQRNKIFDGTVGGTSPWLIDSSNRGAVALADGADVAVGAKADAAAFSGTVSLIALTKALASMAQDKTQTATTMNASGSVCNFSIEGYQGASVHMVNSSLSASFIIKGSADGGTTYDIPIYWAVHIQGVFAVQTAAYGPVAADSNTYELYFIPHVGVTHYQISFPAYTSGSTVVTPHATSIGWQYGPPSVTIPGAYNGNVAPTMRASGMDESNLDQIFRLVLNNSLKVAEANDVGRNLTHYYTLIPVLATATDTLQSLTGTKTGSAVGATTTPAVVTTGKTFRVTRFAATYIATATSGYGIARLRFNTGGVVVITSPVASTIAVGAGTPATANSAGSVEANLESGLEFAAGTGVGISVQGFAAATATAVGYMMVSLSGHEY